MDAQGGAANPSQFRIMDYLQSRWWGQLVLEFITALLILLVLVLILVLVSLLPNDINCYNTRLDKDKDGKVGWSCKADMGIYGRFLGFNESTVVCELGRSPDDVVDDSCDVYSFKNNWYQNISKVVAGVGLIISCYYPHLARYLNIEQQRSLVMFVILGMYGSYRQYLTKRAQTDLNLMLNATEMLKF